MVSNTVSTVCQMVGSNREKTVSTTIGMTSNRGETSTGKMKKIQSKRKIVTSGELLKNSTE